PRRPAVRAGRRARMGRRRRRGVSGDRVRPRPRRLPAGDRAGRGDPGRGAGVGGARGGGRCRMSTLESAVAVPRIARGPRVVRVALAGCGVVGGEWVRLLAHGADEIRARHGLRFELASVLVKHPGRPRPDELPGGVLTTDVDDFLRADAAIWV